MGTAFALPHARTHRLAAEVAGLDAFEVYALTPDAAATRIDDIDPAERSAIIVGSERAGVSPSLSSLAVPVRIPMGQGVDSLNVAAATAIACWALRPDQM